MNTNLITIQSHSKRKLIRAGLLLLMLLPFSLLADDEAADLTWDGLVEIENTNVHSIFVDPNAEFSSFQQVGILRPYVAFRSNWQRDQNRSRSRNVRASDMERIKEDVADLLNDVFVEQLEAAGFEVVNYVDEDVLILRPAIIDLDVTAPDVRSAGRSRTYRASAGAATLILEMFDAGTGDLLGRAIDRRAARSSGGFAVNSNRVTNRADARREFRVWANKLVEFLDQYYVKMPQSE